MQANQDQGMGWVETQIVVGSPAARDLGPRTAPLAIPLARPLVVYVLTAINVLVWLLTTFYAVFNYKTPLGTAAMGDGLGLEVALRRFGGMDSSLIAEGQWWRIFTVMFLHAGIIHLGFNSWALIVLGGEAESLFGRWKFLLYYLLSGLGGSIASLLINRPELSVGASGAIFGAIGLLAGYYWRHRNDLGAAGRSRFFNIILVIVLNMALSTSVARIDNWAHTGGLIGGLLLGLLLAPAYVVRQEVEAEGRGEREAVVRSQPGLQLATLASFALLLIALFAFALSRLPSG